MRLCRFVHLSPFLSALHHGDEGLDELAFCFRRVVFHSSGVLCLAVMSAIMGPLSCAFCSYSQRSSGLLSLAFMIFCMFVAFGLLLLLGVILFAPLIVLVLVW